MALSLVGSDTSTGDPCVCDLPAGIAQGDVVYACNMSGQTTDQNGTEASGTYTELCDLYFDDTTDVNFTAWRKVQGGTPDATVSMDIGGTGQLGLANTIRGADITTPEDATPVTGGATNGGTPDPSAIDTATANAWALVMACSSEADAVTNPPTGYTNLVDLQGTSANIMSATKLVASPGTENPGTFADIAGTGADTWASITVAIRPAVTAVTGTVAATLIKLAQAASGTEKITGTAAQTLIKLAQSVVGSTTSLASGTVAQTLGILAQAASGIEKITGTVAQTLIKLAQEATGTVTAAAGGAAEYIITWRRRRRR